MKEESPRKSVKQSVSLKRHSYETTLPTAEQSEIGSEKGDKSERIQADTFWTTRGRTFLRSISVPCPILTIHCTGSESAIMTQPLKFIHIYIHVSSFNHHPFIVIRSPLLQNPHSLMGRKNHPPDPAPAIP